MEKPASQIIREEVVDGASELATQTPSSKAGITAAGGILGAIAASSCCIVPLALFSVGVGGTWISNLTALAPYQPVFALITFGFLGYGFYLVYWKPKRQCAEDAACARPLPNRIVKLALWAATLLVAAALVFPYAAPLILEY